MTFSGCDARLTEIIMRRCDVALTIDSTLREILADEKGKAVLEKHLPGISTNPQVEMAKGMTLKQLAPLSQGMITNEMLSSIAEDLSKI